MRTNRLLLPKITLEQAKAVMELGARAAIPFEGNPKQHEKLVREYLTAGHPVYVVDPQASETWLWRNLRAFEACIAGCRHPLTVLVNDDSEHCPACGLTRNYNRLDAPR